MVERDDIFLTPEGHNKLVEELNFLVNQKRKEVAQRLREAVGHGDITENSEYDDAKNEQAFVEGRIRQINEVLSRAKILSRRKKKIDYVQPGLLVTLRDLTHNEINTYMLVGSAEANPGEQRISNESPVGRAIMGKRIGDRVNIETPQGKIKCEILDIKIPKMAK